MSLERPPQQVERPPQARAGGGPARDRLEDRVSLAGLCIVAGLSFATSPLDGGYWWSDGPRHALNGAFVLDFVRDMPMGDPIGYAYGYYLRYPALTVFFYPPLVHAVLALAFGVFGVSPLVAQAVVVGFHLALLVGVFTLARRWLKAPYAFGAALIAGAGPEALVWGRQVMLDVPAYALLVGASLCFLRWLDAERRTSPYGCAAFLVAAIYTKYNTGFILLPLAIALLAARGWAWTRDTQVWKAAAAAAVLLVPALVMLTRFGVANITSVIGSQSLDLPRASLGAWTFYLAALPHQLGWPALVLVPVGATLLLRSRAVARADRLLLASWWTIGYLMFSFIALREPRHSLITLVPMAVAAMYALQRFETRVGRLAQVAAVGLALGTTTWGLFLEPVPTVVGHADAARVVTEHARPEENILFSGYRDGSFIFAMRVLGATQHTLRADKLLLRMFIARERGVEDRGLDRTAILALFRKYGIRYVVAESDFWTDLPSMAALDELVQDRTLFAEVARVPIAANVAGVAKQITVVRYLGAVDDPPAPLTIEMVGLGRTISAAAR